MEYVFDRENVNALLEKLEDNDIVKILGEDLINLLKRNSNVQKGRKPIKVDDTQFDETIALWQSGAITARQAMNRLSLKPNTFYRRIKERSRKDMKDLKTEIRKSIKEEKEELKDLKKQVKKEAEDIKAIADDQFAKSVSLHRMERDIRNEKISAEIERKHEEREIKRQVKKEREELKSANK